MRLIYTRTDGKHNRYEMREFFGDTIPKYAILSHTWGEDEVNFKDMQDVNGRRKRKSLGRQGKNKHRERWVKKKEGFRKILYTCEQAQRDGIDWAWIDTCCIDKSSSAELSEAINSMYAWYHSSATCYAYLADVLTDDDLVTEQSRFRGSRWFNRSWTLQELIAPREVKFYDKEWRHIGIKSHTKSPPSPGNEAGPQNGFAKLLEEITGIPKDCLVEHRSPSSYSVAKRMSWASKRKCTRIEDIAYSLIGIFNVNMPLLYGEGAKAFIRLQEEIMKEIDDHSLYAWTLPENDTQSSILSGIFAQSPAAFAQSGNIIPVQEEAEELSLVTRKGLKIQLDMWPAETLRLYRKPSMPEAFYAVLNCGYDGDTIQRIALLLIPEDSKRTNEHRWFYRCATKEQVIAKIDRKPKRLYTIYICKNVPLRIPYAPSPSAFREKHPPGQAYSSLSTPQKLHHVASILLSMGRYGDAEILYRQALDGREASVPHKWSHPAGTPTEETIHRSTRERKQLVLEDYNLEEIIILDNLALALEYQRKYNEAEILHRQVIERREAIQGNSHCDTLTSFANLVSLLLNLDRQDEAEELYEQAINGREAILGKSHADAMGKYEGAETLYRMAWMRAESELGYEHPDTLASLHNLILVLRRSFRDKEAYELEHSLAGELLTQATTDWFTEGFRTDTPARPNSPCRIEAAIPNPTLIFSANWTSQNHQTLPLGRVPRIPRTRAKINGHTAINGVHVRSNDRWFHWMGDFTRFIQTISHRSADPVKIAVIDYGLDDALDIHDENIAWVKSFRSSETREEAMYRYFSGHLDMHWAQTSALVSQICPTSRLYVALLDVFLNSGRPETTESSLMAAIQWAINCKVDVISIHCNIRSPLDTDETSQLLISLRLASDSGITILAPVGGYENRWVHILGIGVPTLSHQPSRPHPDFIYSGERITFVDSYTTIVSYESAGSVATAVASGIVGLILHCARLVGLPLEVHWRPDLLSRAFHIMKKGSSSLGSEWFFRQMISKLPSPDELELVGSAAMVKHQKWKEALKNAFLWNIIPDSDVYLDLGLDSDSDSNLD